MSRKQFAWLVCGNLWESNGKSIKLLFFLTYQYACVFVFQCISPKHAAKQYLPPGSGKHVMKIQHCNQESAMFSKCHQRTMVARSGGLVYTKKGPHWKQPERAQKMKVTND